MKVAKIFRFEAAHTLTYHKGKCRFTHGHSYKAELMFEGPVHDPFSKATDAGMVIDFAHIARVWEGTVDEYLDHSGHGTLNEALGLNMPTAEMIAAWITAWFVRAEMPIVHTKLWETDNAWALCEATDPMVQLILARKMLPDTNL